MRELALLPFEATPRCSQVWTWSVTRCFVCGLGLVTEFALFSPFAFSTCEIEADLAARQGGSDQFLLYQIGSTYALTSAISIQKCQALLVETW